MVKSLCANAGDVRNTGSIPGLGRSPGDHQGNSSILAWRIPWTEEPGRLQSIEADMTEVTLHARTVGSTC